ncbi:hypothetical protein IID62_04990 [candidate division KSB1 bacterium]|nr:hypothetical protein [candidate division KSB1 bacterium]
MFNYQSSPVRIMMILFVLTGISGSSFARVQADTQDASSKDLKNLYKTGYILQDRNDDSVIDFVNTKIILPANIKIGDLVSGSMG